MKPFDEQEIIDLIESSQEGLYWDFKQNWYSDGKFFDLLHDIICLANNVLLRDAYIIIGVADDGVIRGLGNDKSRKNTQQLIEIFRNRMRNNDVKFTGGIRPSFAVNTMTIDENEIDVITIFSQRHTPYYLEKEFKETQKGGKEKILLPYAIYTREQDGNTPINSSANFRDVELLWRNRFGLEKNVYERFLTILDQHDQWEHDFGNKNYAFHKTQPEFRIVAVDDEDERVYRDAWEPQAALYTRFHMTVRPMHLMYHSTIIKEMELVTFDEYRVYLPWGKRGRMEDVKFTELGTINTYGFGYVYYCLDDYEGKIYRILDKIYKEGGFPFGLVRNPERFIYPFLVFENENERKDFEEFTMWEYNNIQVSAIKEKHRFTIEGGFAGKHHAHNEERVLEVVIASELYTGWQLLRQSHLPNQIDL